MRTKKNHHCLSLESHNTSYDQFVVKMLKNTLVLLSLAAAAYGSSKLTVLESPKQILFKRADKLDGKYIGHVFSAFTGHSISDSVPLKVQFISPFDLAENVCLININGIKEFTPQNIKPKSEIDVYGTENSNEAFLNKLYEDGSSIVNIDLNNEFEALSNMQNWCETPLKLENSKFSKSMKGDKNIEMEAAIVLSVLSEAKCKMPAFLQIDFNVDPKSSDKDLVPLFEAIEKFAQKYQKVSNGLGLLAVFTTVEQQAHKRTRRAAQPNPDDLNLADSYSEDYPVIFNIILWFGVLIAFSMLAICYAIATMDPGRDSIIYRMTSTRIKKDN